MKEVREFFLRHFPVLAGSKRDREVGYPTQYTTTNIHGEIMLAYNRFLKGDYPSEATFRKFLESITFKLNAEDTATDTEQGLVSMATTAEAIAGTNTDINGYTLTIRPSDYKVIWDLMQVLQNNSLKIWFYSTMPTVLTQGEKLGDIGILGTPTSADCGTMYELTDVTLGAVVWTPKYNTNKLPSGGSAGDVLAKPTPLPIGNNFATQWVAPFLPIGTKILLADVNCNTGALPTINIIINTIGTLTWNYAGIGQYMCYCTGAFTENKTFAALTVSSLLYNGSAYARRGGIDVVEIGAYIVDEYGGITNSDAVFNDGRLMIIVLP